MVGVVFVTSLLSVLLFPVTHAAWAVQIEADECASGSQQDGEGGCIKCRIGFFRERGAHPECQPCPHGWITREIGAWMKTECDLAVGARDDCPSGQEWTGTSENCAVCKLGTYRTKTRDYWCVDCPPGRNTSLPGAISVEDCIVPVSCMAGMEWNTTTSSCEPCKYNTYRPGGSTNTHCYRCPDDHVTLNRGSRSHSECFSFQGKDFVLRQEDCPAGTQYEPSMNLCGVCPAATYRSPDDPFTSCITCPEGTSTLTEGATVHTLCMTEEEIISHKQLVKAGGILCPLGSEWSEWEEPVYGRVTGCRPCGWGTYRDTDHAPLCKVCPPGTITYTPGATSVLQCINSSSGRPAPEGSQELLPAFSKEECPVGTGWNSTHLACVQCERATYRGREEAVCVACPANTSTLSPGGTSVSSCTLHTHTHVNNPFFTGADCPLGSEWDRFSRACRPCPLGFYREHQVTAACETCPSGLTTLTPGSTSRFLCSVPREGPDRTPIGSDGCEPGYTEAPDRRECIPCTPGTFKKQLGFGPCTECPQGPEGEPLKTPRRAATDISQCIPSGHVRMVTPAHGPQSGGTVVEVQVETPVDFRVTSIYIGATKCQLQAFYLVDGIISCVTAPVRTLPQPAPLHVEALDGLVLSSWHNYTYLPDPVIHSIDRLTTITSGGLTLTIRGDNLNSVAFPSLILYNTQPANNDLDQLEWACYTPSKTIMHCNTPDLSEITNSLSNQGTRLRRETGETGDRDTHTFHLGLQLDGVRYYRNLSDVIPMYGTLVVFPDPVIYLFPEQDQLREYSPGTTTITLQGKDLDLALTLDDYKVTIGSCKAAPSVLRRESLDVVLCDDIPENKNQPVRVSMASISAHLGDLRITNPVKAASTADTSSRTLSIIVPVIVIAGLLLVVAIAVTAVLMYRKKHEKNKSLAPDANLAAFNGHVVDPRLPPLPVNSVFGPERVTVVPGVQGYTTLHSKRDRGMTMRQLALPDTLSGTPAGLNVVEALEVGNQDLLRYDVEEDFNFMYKPDKTDLPGTSSTKRISSSSSSSSHISASPPSSPSCTSADNTPLFIKNSPPPPPNNSSHKHVNSAHKAAVGGAADNPGTRTTAYKARYQSNRTRPLSAGSGSTARPKTPPTAPHTPPTPPRQATPPDIPRPPTPPPLPDYQRY